MGYLRKSARAALTWSAVRPGDGVRAAFDHDEGQAADQRGQPVAGELDGQDAVLVALDDQDRDVEAGDIGTEVGLSRSGRTPPRRSARAGDGDVEAGLERLVGDQRAAVDVHVVKVVEEPLEPGRPVRLRGAANPSNIDGGTPRGCRRRRRSTAGSARSSTALLTRPDPYRPR